MQATKSHHQASRLAEQLMRARADLIHEGGTDPAIQEILQSANAEFSGNVEAAGKSAIDAVRQATITVREERRQTAARRHAALNTPENKAKVAEIFHLLDKAAELEKRAVGVERTRAEKIESLKKQGVEHSAAVAAAGDACPEKMRADAQEMRQRAAAIESELKLIEVC